MTALFIIITFTSNSITQDLQDDPQQGDSSAGVKVQPEKILPEKANVYDIEFSPDGKRLAVVGDFGILLYDTQIIEKPIKIAGNTGPVWNVEFTPDGKLLIIPSPH